MQSGEKKIKRKRDFLDSAIVLGAGLWIFGTAQPTTDPPNAPTPAQSDYERSVTPSYALSGIHAPIY